jgi:hypothetical protein
MSDNNKIEFLKGSLRYKQASDVSIQMTLPLSGKIKELDENVRQASVNLTEVYDNERQNSFNFFPSCKFQLLFSNTYSGITQPVSEPHRPYNNNLYYVNAEETKAQQVLTPITLPWPGIPQYNEFSFIRTDFGINGYTSGPNAQVDAMPLQANKYNWSFYLSYVSGMDSQKTLSYDFGDGLPNSSDDWVISDGIPYRMSRVSSDGKAFWQCRTAFKHNLIAGEYVEFSNIEITNSLGVVIPDRNLFEIFSLGDGTYGSESTIFNILDVGYNTGPNTFEQDKVGTLRRVIDSDNPIESKSNYYVRLHTILTNQFDAVTTFTGFEQNAFRTKKKFETAALTPNNLSRISVLEDSQSYNLSFNRSVNITGFLDNHNRPVSEIFFTVVHRGYFGWFTPPTPQGNGLKEGWKFNIRSVPTAWWERNNPNSDLNLSTSSYLYNSGGVPQTFYYNDYYNQGEQIYGDVCEWNNMELKETVLSEYYHKFVFNPQVFDINTSLDNPSGYYYIPHYKLKIREYSDYIEQGNSDVTVGIPDYAFYSEKNKTFFWRDLYPYGFVDSDGNGVDYPFFNNRHYPYDNFFFRIIPEGSNTNFARVIPIPTIDGCE